SSTANVTTTGTFTIPLMKRIGVKPEVAGGIEASASTMGQITPPVMGAAAFLLAEYTGIPYLRVAMAAGIPALLAFYSMFIQVDFMAAFSGLRGIPRPDLPRLRQVLREGGYFLLPLVALVYFLMAGYSPERAIFWTILVTIAIVLVAGVVRGEARETARQIVLAFRDGAADRARVPGRRRQHRGSGGHPRRRGHHHRRHHHDRAGPAHQHHRAGPVGRQLVAGGAVGRDFVAYSGHGHSHHGQLRHPGHAGGAGLRQHGRAALGGPLVRVLLRPAGRRDAAGGAGGLCGVGHRPVGPVPHGG